MSPEDLTAARRAMVAEQLRDRGVADERVLEAMEQVPRERFVMEELEDNAYDDRALYIGCQQTISQPYMVALMTEALQLEGDEKVLEIGTGSGYQAAVLSRLAERVVSVERHEELSAQAEQVLASLGCDNVKLVVGDGTLGRPEEGPYDRIIVTAAAGAAPPSLLGQLKQGGILVIPIGPEDRQMLHVIRKIEDGLDVQQICACRFVPLIGVQGRAEE